MGKTTSVIAGAVILASAAAGGVGLGRQITSAQIADNTVRSVDIRNDDVALVDLQPAVRNKIAGSLSGYTMIETRMTLNRDERTIKRSCPDGKVALAGSERTGNAFDVDSYPIYDETTDRASGWAWDLDPTFDGDVDEDVWLYVTCANG